MTYEFHCSRCYMRHGEAVPCIFTENLNLTSKRLLALKVVSEGPGRGVFVSHVADQVLTSEYRREHRSGFTAQQATRAGAGYVIPMIKAGLLEKHDETYGWGRVTLTDAGRKVLADHKAASDPANMSLDAVIARTRIES